LAETLAAHPKTSWDAVVWAGTGHGSDLSTIRQLPAARRVYLEPHPALYAKLAAACTPERGESALPMALWRTSGQRDFYLVSNPLKGSLLPPDGVLARMPNLTLIGNQPVDTLGLDDLVERFALGAQRNSLLVMDVAGAEMEVLGGASRTVIGAFSTIVVCEAAAGDYTGASPLRDTMAYLAQLGYVGAVPPGAEGPYGRVAMMVRDDEAWNREARMNDLQTKNLALKGEVQDLVSRLEAQREEVESLRLHAHELGTARDQHAQLAAETRSENEVLSSKLQALAEARDQHGQLAAESQKEIEVLVAQVQSQAETIAGLRVHATELGQARDQHAQWLNERDQQLGELQGRLQAQGEQLDAFKQQAWKLGGARDQQAQLALERQERIDALVAELAAKADEVQALKRHATDLGSARDTHAQDATQLRAQSSAQVADIEGLREQLSAQVAELQALRLQASELGAARDEQARMVAEKQQQAMAQAEEIRRLGQHAYELGTARDEQARVAEERARQIEALVAQTVEQSAQLDALRHHASELGTARDQFAQTLEQREAHLDRLERERVDHEAQLQQARQAAALSLKLQMLRESDLKELQERYQEALAVQERQHQMLTKLGERMSVASRYFHQLAEAEAGGATAIDRPATAGRDAGASALPVAPARRKPVAKKPTRTRTATSTPRGPRQKG
jgi:FkbM family methyltransferase